MEKRKKTDARSKNISLFAKTQPEKTDYILNIKNITKTFLDGKIIANDNVSISFRRGDIHSIVGENGSGKSTLMSILFGLYKQDKGEIFIDGNQVDMSSTGSAKKHKIGMVHQHFHLIDAFTVLDNIILGQESINYSEEKISEMENKIFLLDKEISKNSDELIEKVKSILEGLKSHKYNDVKSKNIYRQLTEKINRLDKDLVEKVEQILKESRPITSNDVDNKLLYREFYKQIKDLNNKREAKKICRNLIKRKLQGFLVEKNEKLYSKTSLKYHQFCIKDNFELTKAIELKEKIEVELKSSTLVGKFGKLNRKGLIERFNIIREKYNISLDPYALVSTLSVGQRQMVEIFKVLWEEKELLVLDEPTATLSISEIDALTKTILSLKKEGKTIIFISHKLQEVKSISDRISILKKGSLVKTFKNTSSLKIEEISKLMVGKIVKLNYPARQINDNYVMEVKNLSYKTRKGFRALNNISFKIKQGEIFGLAGIEGNGQEEVIKILTNMKNASDGMIFYKNKLLADRQGFKLESIDRRKLMSHIPIDRMKYGIVPNKDLEFNAKISDFDTDFFMESNGETINSFTQKIIKDFKVEGLSKHETEIRNLSGGNQQKFVVGREILRDHEILIAGHPTRGLDILAIDNIYKKMLLNSTNKITILYSLEITELVAICDRIAIMYKGKIIGIVDPKITSFNEISKMMTGENK